MMSRQEKESARLGAHEPQRVVVSRTVMRAGRTSNCSA